MQGKVWTMINILQKQKAFAVDNYERAGFSS